MTIQKTADRISMIFNMSEWTERNKKLNYTMIPTPEQTSMVEFAKALNNIGILDIETMEDFTSPLIEKIKSYSDISTMKDLVKESGEGFLYILEDILEDYQIS